MRIAKLTVSLVVAMGVAGTNGVRHPKGVK